MKKYLILLLIICLAFFASGCSNNSVDSAKLHEETTPETETSQMHDETNIEASENDKLTDKPQYESAGTFLVYYSYSSGKSDIYKYDIEKDATINLTSEYDFGAKTPCISPDGKKIAFISGSRQHGHGAVEQNICIINSDGTGFKRLNIEDHDMSHAAWSPNGKMMAFMSEASGNRDIYYMNLDGSGIIKLTDNEAEDMRPAWSPDSKKIAFNSYRDDNWEIYIIDIDTMELTRLTNTPEWEIFPCWSPDSKQIVYGMTAANTYNLEVVTMDVESGETIQLTRGAGVSENPYWSPDGESIVFQSNRDGKFKIYIMNSDGTNQQVIAQMPEDVYWPSIY